MGMSRDRFAFLWRKFHISSVYLSYVDNWSRGYQARQPWSRGPRPWRGFTHGPLITAKCPLRVRMRPDHEWQRNGEGGHGTGT